MRSSKAAAFVACADPPSAGMGLAVVALAGMGLAGMGLAGMGVAALAPASVAFVVLQGAEALGC